MYLVLVREREMTSVGEGGVRLEARCGLWMEGRHIGYVLFQRNHVIVRYSYAQQKPSSKLLFRFAPDGKELISLVV